LIIFKDGFVIFLHNTEGHYLNDSLHITRFSSEGQLALFYKSGAISSTKIMWLMQFREITDCFWWK